MITTKDAYINTKKLPKAYQFLNLRICLNKNLYEEKVISFDVFDKMQKLLFKEMDKIILEKLWNDS